MPWGSDWHPRKPGGKARAESLHFFSTEPLFLIPFGSLPAVQEVTSDASESFRRNQFSSCPGDRTGTAEARRSGRRGVVAGNFFSTEPLFLIPPAQISGLTEAKGSGLSQRASRR